MGLKTQCSNAAMAYCADMSLTPEKADCPMICVPLEIVTLARFVQE